MRAAVLVLAVAVLASGLIVAWSIDRASHRAIRVQIITSCPTKGSVYGRRC